MNIWSFGDSELLWQALNGLALVFQGNTMNKVMTIAVILFLLVGMCSALLRVGGFYQNDSSSLTIGPWSLLAPILIGLLFITPKSEVAVHDAYNSGNVRTVNNVPTLLAVPFSLTSSIGLYFVEAIEFAFSSPNGVSMITDGFIPGPKMMQKATTLTSSGPVDPIRSSFANYFGQCVKLELESVDPQPMHTMDQIMNSPDPWPMLAAMGAFTNWDTVIFVNASGVEVSPNVVPCTVAATTLTAVANLAFSSNLSRASQWLSEIVEKRPEGEPAESVDVTIDKALGFLGMSGISAQKVALNQVLKRSIQQSAMESATADGNAAWAVMINEAKQKEFIKVTAGKTMFESYVRPLMAFIEFVVCIMAILAPIFAAMQRYDYLSGWVVSMLWVAMWPAILAVCNIYIHSGMEAQLTETISRLGIAGMGAGEYFQSMTGSVYMLEIANEWISIGSMMASATPMITAAILGGSLMTLGGMMSGSSAGGKVGGDVNAGGISVPAIAPPPGFVQQQSGKILDANGNSFSNLKELSSVGSSLGASSTLTNSNAQARSTLDEANQTLGTLGAKALTSGATSLQSLADTVSKAAGLGAERGKFAQAGESAFNKATSQMGLQNNDGRRQAQQDAANASVAVNGGANFAVTQGSLGASLSKNLGLTQEQGLSLAGSILDQASGGRDVSGGVRGGITGTRAETASKAFNAQLSSALGETDSKTYSDQIGRTQKASEQLSKNATSQQQVSNGKTGTTGELAAIISNLSSGDAGQRQQAAALTNQINGAVAALQKADPAGFEKAQVRADAVTSGVKGGGRDGENLKKLEVLAQYGQGSGSAEGSKIATAALNGIIGSTFGDANLTPPKPMDENTFKSRMDAGNGAAAEAANGTKGVDASTAPAGGVSERVAGAGLDASKTPDQVKPNVDLGGKSAAGVQAAAISGAVMASQPVTTTNVAQQQNSTNGVQITPDAAPKNSGGAGAFVKNNGPAAKLQEALNALNPKSPSGVSPTQLFNATYGNQGQLQGVLGALGNTQQTPGMGFALAGVAEKGGEAVRGFGDALTGGGPEGATTGAIAIAGTNIAGTIQDALPRPKFGGKGGKDKGSGGKAPKGDAPQGNSPTNSGAQTPSGNGGGNNGPVLLGGNGKGGGSTDTPAAKQSTSVAEVRQSPGFPGGSGAGQMRESTERNLQNAK